MIRLLLALNLVQPVSAHSLVTDGTIGAIIHVDPDDDPVIGQPAGLHFTFQDTAERFQLASCRCSAVVKRDGKELTSQLLVQSADNSGGLQYTFPEKGVYSVQVLGVPKTPDAFQPFSLTYDIRVEREGTSQRSPWLWPALLIGGAALTALLLAASRRPAQPQQPASS